MELIFVFLAPLAIALASLWMVITALKSGSITRLDLNSLTSSYRNHKTLSRRQDPGHFWFTVSLFGVVTVLMLLLSVRAFSGLTLVGFI